MWDLVLTQILFVVGLPWIGVAAKLGSAHAMYWMLAILTFYIPCAAVVIFLNSKWPLEGGLYQWARHAFGPFTGFLTAWNLWLYVIMLTSESGLQVVTYVAYAVNRPDIASNKLLICAANVGVCVLLTWLSIAGLHFGKWLHNVAGVVIVVAFVTIIVLAAFTGRYHPVPLAMPAVSLFSVNILSKLGFGALGGFEYVAILAGETRKAVRSFAGSVLIAAPVIGLMFILGTSAVIAVVQGGEIELIGPVAQVLSLGAKPFGLATQAVSLAICMVASLRVAQASVNFTGNTRLPMVAGWDHLLPKWFTKLDPKRGTPVNSILFVGAATLAVSMLSLIGVGHEEAFQLLWNTSIVFYALPYLVMFAIPLVVPAPLWLRMAAVSGFVMTFLGILFAVVPIIDVKSTWIFAAKMTGVVIAGNVLGVLIYLGRAAITASSSSSAPAKK